MKSYIIYDTLGKILRTGTCLDSDYQYQVGHDEFIMEGKAFPDKQYIVGGNIIDLPLKPEGIYFFDYTTKEWVFNIELGTEAALQKRDKLLADGPDRISPVWWSSMTPEEQQAWTDYRQALLDITEQPNYPQEIIWPTKP
jgi:hypothetical protein